MRRAVFFLIGLALAAGGGSYAWRVRHEPGAPKPAAAAPSVPLVHVAEVARRDVPVYVRGIGQVQPFNIVQIKSRVDGQIDRVLFTEGQQVQAGDVLIEIDPRPYQAAVNQAEGALAKDQAQLVSAKADLDRQSSLLQHGYASKQAFDQQQAVVGQLMASIRADQGALDAARLNLQFATIRAPITGRIGKRLVDAGNIVHANDTVALAEIVQTHPITALFTVPQGALAEIRAQMQMGRLPVDALSTDDRKALSRGTLTLIGNQVDPASGTIELKASFDNGDDALWPGQLVEARLTLQQRRDVVAVPSSAIVASTDGKVVFVVDNEHHVTVRKVVIGPVSDGKSVVESGLQAGEQVVIDKLDLLVPGLAVQPDAES